MAEYDGSIRIGTKIDAKDLSVQLKSMENRIAKTADKVGMLQSKMESLKNAKIPTAEYTEIQKQIDITDKKLKALYERKEKFLNTGGKTNSSSYQKMQYDIEALENTIKYARGELQALVDEGKDFTLGSNTQEYASLGQQLGYAKSELEVLCEKHSILIEKQNSAASGYEKLGKSAKTSLEKISKASEKSNKSLSAIGSGFKNLMRRVYALFSKLRTVIKEVFTNLYNYNDSFKSSVDGLKSSYTSLKNSLAAAFAPLVQMAIPYIQKVIDYITQLLGLVGQFTAAITGQKTYTKAIKQTTDAIEDETEASEVSNKQLSGLDSLNNLSSSSGTSADNGTETMFEEVPVDSSIIAFTDTLRGKLQSLIEYAQGLKDVFLQGFWDGLGDWETRWESIEGSASSIKDSLIGIFADPEVASAADSWGQSVSYMLGSLSGSVGSIGLTIATNLLGGVSIYLEQNSGRIKEYLTSMFDVGAEINSMFAALFQSIAYIFEAFGSESGQQLTANIIGIFSGAFMGINELALKLFGDIANIIIQPFTENQEGFRSALEGFLDILGAVAGTIKDGIETTFDKLNEVYDTHFKPFFDSISEGLSDTIGKFLEFWNGSLQPMLDNWAEKFDDLWKNHIQPFLNNIGDLLGSVADLLQTLWETTLKPVIDWIIQNVLPVLLPIFDAIYNTVVTVIGDIADIFSGLIGIIKGIIDFISVIIKGDWDSAWKAAGEIVQNIFNTIQAFTKTIWDSISGVIKTVLQVIIGAFKTTFQGIYDFVSGIWNYIKQNASSFFTSFKSAISTALAAIKNAWSTSWSNVKSTVVSVWSNIKSTVSNAINGVKSTISTVLSSIKSTWSNVWTTIKSTVSSIFSGIKSTISTVISSVKNTISTALSGIKSTWSNVFTGIKSITTNIFNGIWSSIKGVINGILGGVEKMANGVIKGINTVIGAINKLSFTIPDWVPSLGSKKFGFNISKLSTISIPKLATGTVVPPNNEFMAVLGDNKKEPEVVSPLSTIEQAVENVLKRNGNNGNGKEITLNIPVTLDGREVFRIIQKYDLEHFKRTGKPAFSR